ncbi:hypothetical protein [Desulfovibrio litoralis]|uniref:EF hand n=1 Tax=Desulfovibrio litoralis DSM 11393 TaxID=1121455 RepID=A0A1M7S7B0_9BACT|nr:hypothetical protein [Desulfovibrio litoralis]SHN54313.1 hypothetical protein SAMN02745728_00520 [Desulfovibrio litoralis DSM 11393]
MLNKTLALICFSILSLGFSVYNINTAQANPGMAKSEKTIAGHEELDAQFQRSDANNDGNWNWEEFQNAYPKMQKPAFEAMDSDKNDLVSKKEWLEFKMRHAMETSGSKMPSGTMQKEQNDVPSMITPPKK